VSVAPPHRVCQSRGVTPGVPIRRFGAIGDVHCEDAALASALELFDAQGVDAVLCVGDILDGRGDPNRTLRLLRDAGVISVRGNHDRWYQDGEMRDLSNAVPVGTLEADAADFLASLPTTRELATAAGPLLLCHGVGGDDMVRLRDFDEGVALETNEALQEILAVRRYRVVVGGHTHLRMVRVLGGIVFLNAGTLKPDDEPCVMSVDLTARTASFFDWRGDGLWAEPQIRRFPL
jgi:putative phosphoesterase